MTNEFDYNGHRYKVVKAEGGDGCFIIKDGRHSRKVCKEIADRAIEYVERLFS